MRIGLVTSVGVTLDAFFPELVDAWQDRGHSVHAIAGSPASQLESSVEPSITRSPRPRNILAPSRIRKWAASQQLDVVLTNTATASTLVRLAGPSCPVVYFCHGLHWNQATPANAPVRMLEKALVKRTSGIVTINSADEEWFQLHAPGCPMVRLPAGVGLDLRQFPRTARPVGDLEILWVGEFSDRKRPLAALQVAAALRDSSVVFNLTMLGIGPMLPEAQALRTQLELESCVTLEGHQPVEPFLQRCNAVLHTARWEGLPRVLLEAVAVGRPIFAYDVKGVRDIPGIHLSSDDRPFFLARDIEDFSRRQGTWSAPDREPLSYEEVASELEKFMADISGVRL